MSLDTYKQKSVWLIGKLIEHFQFRDFQGAGVCGNGWQESGLQPVLENDGIVTSITRGIGFFQWTGPRHKAFLQWCQDNKLSWRSDDAEFGFLRHELMHNYSHLPAQMRATRTLAEATEVFEKYYEGAGVVAMSHRLKAAQIALDAYHESAAAKPAPAQ